MPTTPSRGWNRRAGLLRDRPGTGISAEDQVAVLVRCRGARRCHDVREPRSGSQNFATTWDGS
jgi:hypothetical protein